MTEEVGKKVCEGTVADLMKDKTGKQTVITLTRKNAYRVKKIREQGTDDEAVLFHFRKRCTENDRQLKTSYNKYQQAVKVLIMSVFSFCHLPCNNGF